MTVATAGPLAAEAYAYEQVSVVIDEGGIALVTLERPDKLNAVGETLHFELSLLFRALERDPAVRVVVLTGRGRAFSAGGDLDFMQDMIDRPALFERVIREAKEIVLSMLDCEKPIIAKLNGSAVGLGATLALFADVIFMADRAKIGDPHVGIGLVAADGGAIIWPQLIGFARAKEYLLSGDLLTAPEALTLGLVNHVVPAEELDARVAEFATRLSQGAQGAIRYTKATINIALKQVANAALDAGLGYEAVTNLSADHREAVAAFRDGRSPVFL